MNMLTPDQVKPLLFHQNSLVREAAAAYLGDSHARDPEIVKLFLQANERFDDFKERSLIKCQYLFINDENLDRLIDLAANARTKHERFVLSAILLSAPHRLSAAREGAIKNLGAVYRFVEFNWNLIFRLDPSPAETLWKIFVAVVRRLALVDRLTNQSDPARIDDEAANEQIDDTESAHIFINQDPNVSERLSVLDELVRRIVDQNPGSNRIDDSQTCIIKESDPLNDPFDRMGDDVDILASLLAQALAERDVPDWDVFHHAFQDYRDHSPKSLAILIRLAGMRRFQASIPYLIHELQFGDDLTRIEAFDALESIGDAEVAHAIAEQIRPIFAEMDRARSAESVAATRVEIDPPQTSRRISLADLLGRIKSPESEAFLLEWLEHEHEEIIRFQICDSLCSLFSRQAFVPIVQQIERNEAWNPDRIYRERLENGLLTLYFAFNLNISEIVGDIENVFEQNFEVKLNLAIFFMSIFKRYINRIEKETEYQKIKLKTLQSRNKKLTILREHLEKTSLWLKDILISSPPIEMDPAFFKEPDGSPNRAGRNDPCPCGSGKKFKKCCINKIK